MTLTSMVHELSGKTLLDRFFAGTIGQADLVTWDSTFATIGLAQTVVYLATAVLWLVWQYRLVASVEPLVHDEPLKTPGRSVLWWFVPFANLVVVYRIYQDLQANFAPQSGSIVGQWWGAYLISNIVANVAGRLWANANTPADFTAGLNLWLFSDLLSIVSGLVAMRLVWRLQAGQDRALAAPPPPPPPVPAIEPAPDPTGAN